MLNLSLAVEVFRVKEPKLAEAIFKTQPLETNGDFGEEWISIVEGLRMSVFIDFATFSQPDPDTHTRSQKKKKKIPNVLGGRAFQMWDLGDWFSSSLWHNWPVTSFLEGEGG